MAMLNILCVWLLLSVSSADMKNIRAMYLQAPEDEAKATTLLRLLREHRGSIPTLQGYKGAVTMVMAKHAFNPHLKLRYFNDGRILLEDAIARDKGNVELHYLRCTIQVNLPVFLGYDQHIEEDMRFLQKRVHSITDAQLRHMVQSFLDQQTNDND